MQQFVSFPGNRYYIGYPAGPTICRAVTCVKIVRSVFAQMRTIHRNSVSTGSSEKTPEDAVSPAAVNAGPQRGGSPSEQAVFSTDLQGNFTGCNQEFTDLFGYGSQDLIGRELTGLFSLVEKASKQDSLQFKKEIAVLASGSGHFESLLFAHPRSDQTFKAQLSLSLLRAGSAPSGLVGFVQQLPPSASDATRVGESSIASREIDGTQFILASPVMHKFMGLVDRVAGHTETVLITGETGTGKELIARTIHESSHRRGRAWIDINCAALPENLVESELFGYEKGAFSGADASKPGLFEMADKGTIFLDEIGELQLQTQGKLLRVLDGQPFYRLGGHRKIKVDVRIVAATNQDLETAVKEGRFRKDLFHRLGQFQLGVPPLRERPEDIVALAEHFLKLKTPGKSFSSDAISSLLSHAWPGNIRELRNMVAKIAVETTATVVEVDRISATLSREPAALRQTASMPVGNLDSMEEQMIIKALERTGGHRAMAAEQLGISRRTLSRKLKEYNLNFAAGDGTSSLGFISTEQQKFFRARVDLAVTVRNAQGEEILVQGVNLSTGGMGLHGVNEPLRLAGLLDISFTLPESDIRFEAKGRLMWVGEEGRVGIRFAVIDPALFEQLQHWTNKKMKEEGWDFPS